MIDNYQWGRHHRSLIANAAKARKATLHEVAEACGYKNVNKVQRKRQNWSMGLGEIPLAYLDLLNLPLADIEAAVARDIVAARQAFDAVESNDHFLFKIIPGIYARKSFPVAPIADCIEFARCHAREIPVLHFIQWPTIRTIQVYPNGKVAEWGYPPKIDIKNGFISFGYDGAQNYSTRVG
jgi:hypothetical protein